MSYNVSCGEVCRAMSRHDIVCLHGTTWGVSCNVSCHEDKFGDAVDMVTGVATATFKSGNKQLWSRYRVIVVFLVEFKIFSIMLYLRIVAECMHYISDRHYAFRRKRGTSDVHYVAKQMYRAICQRGTRAAMVHLDYKSAFDSLSHFYLCLLYTSPSPRDRG